MASPDRAEWGHTEKIEYAVDSPFVGVVVACLAAGAVTVSRRRRDVAATIAAAATVAFLAFFGPVHRRE